MNAVLGRGFTQTVAAVALTWWPSYARLIRAQILTVKNEQYVMAARAAGVRPAGILVRHVLRNSIDPIIVSITLDVGYIALATAALSFVGLGADHPTPEWGRMVAQGRDYLLVQWWYSTYPGMALFLLVVSFNLFSFLDRLDPKYHPNSGVNLSGHPPIYDLGVCLVRTGIAHTPSQSQYETI